MCLLTTIFIFASVMVFQTAGFVNCRQQVSTVVRCYEALGAVVSAVC